MTATDRKIIKDLYGIVVRNLRQNGRAMRFGSDLVLSCIPEEGGLFDPEDLEGLSCKDFVFACYMRLLGRIPERALRTFPTPADPIPSGCDKAYDAFILPAFLNSMEFKVVHDIEDPPSAPPPREPLGKRIENRLRSLLKPVTPLFLRKILNAFCRHD